MPGRNRLSVLLLWWFCASWLTLVARVSAEIGWFSPSEMIYNTSSEVYFHEIGVFVNATRLSYVSTSGAYFENWTVNESINLDWDRPKEFFLNPPFGLRALTFKDDSKLRIVIAFRGTDLSQDIGGICDQCADMILWGGVPYDNLPPVCQQFNKSTLDYLDGALNYASEVNLRYPLYDIMYTGHSLGAGLAAVTSVLGNMPLNFGCAPMNAGAIVFSPPGYIATLMNRSGVDLALADPRTVVAFADRWDPVWVGCNASAYGGVLAQICEWFTAATPPCVACDANAQPLPPNTTACNECMLQKHIFSHYEVLSTTSPTCQSRPRQECEGLFSCPTFGSRCSL